MSVQRKGIRLYVWAWGCDSREKFLGYSSCMASCQFLPSLNTSSEPPFKDYALEPSVCFVHFHALPTPSHPSLGSDHQSAWHTGTSHAFPLCAAVVGDTSRWLGVWANVCDGQKSSFQCLLLRLFTSFAETWCLTEPGTHWFAGLAGMSSEILLFLLPPMPRIIWVQRISTCVFMFVNTLPTELSS